MPQFNAPINVWQYREPSELSITTSLDSEISTSGHFSLQFTSITTPDPPEMAANMQAWVDFHVWIMSESAESRRLYRDACQALLIDLDNSLAVEEQANGVSNAADEEHSAPFTDTPNPDDGMELPSSLPSATHSPAPSASPSFFSEDIEMPRLCPQRTSQRSNSVPASSPPASSSVAFDYSTNLWVSPVHVNHRIFDTGTVFHNKPQLVPDVLYTGRTPPFWRWSDSNLPQNPGMSGGRLKTHEAPFAGTRVRDDSGKWETISYGSGPCQHSTASLPSIGSGYPIGRGEATVPNEPHADEYAAEGNSSGAPRSGSRGNRVLKRIRKAIMRKLKGFK